MHTAPPQSQIGPYPTPVFQDICPLNQRNKIVGRKSGSFRDSKAHSIEDEHNDKDDSQISGFRLKGRHQTNAKLKSILTFAFSAPLW